jgi:hypothetical protein
LRAVAFAYLFFFGGIEVNQVLHGLLYFALLDKGVRAYFESGVVVSIGVKSGVVIWSAVEWVSIVVNTFFIVVSIIIDTFIIVVSIVVVDTFIIRQVLNGVAVSSGACPEFFILLAEACK